MNIHSPEQSPRPPASKVAAGQDQKSREAILDTLHRVVWPQHPLRESVPSVPAVTVRTYCILHQHNGRGEIFLASRKKKKKKIEKSWRRSVLQTVCSGIMDENKLSFS